MTQALADSSIRPYANGVIRNQFEILPELKNGSVLLVPVVEGGEVTWQCRVEGNIERRYVPATCRD